MAGLAEVLGYRARRAEQLRGNAKWSWRPHFEEQGEDRKHVSQGHFQNKRLEHRTMGACPTTALSALKLSLIPVRKLACACYSWTGLRKGKVGAT
ncbi:hypothetical protein Trco_003765 [Trichoderma cornu-damae]|uniref:Uncharacterized protein n=1 Tax=Trichoderma cornu-damae TaxID=654480 RepID=A0A9P8QRZ5_9HYPO|nr:hypothetical protein Trco_003765 [Trichoderma cornu-damae]